MTIIGYVLMALAFLAYGTIIKAVFRLVAETRQLNSGVRFNRFWWTPAWKVHRGAYPMSPVRNQIIVRFLVTFALMLAGMACIAFSLVRNMPHQVR
jgi:hypothetical protein